MSQTKERRPMPKSWMCEKCWADAYLAMRMRGGSQADHYRRLIEERKNDPCSPDEQRGAW